MGFTGSVIVAALIAICLAFAYVMFKRESRMLENLAVALGGENKSSILRGNYVKLDIQGVELQIRLMPGSSDSGYGPQLIILKRIRPPFRMQIASSTWESRLGNAIGLLKDITVGDPDIDKRYRIKASNEEEAIAYINDPQKREALTYFFNEGFTDIRFSVNDVCVIKPENHHSDLIPQEMNRHLEHFALLFPN